MERFDDFRVIEQYLKVFLGNKPNILQVILAMLKYYNNLIKIYLIAANSMWSLSISAP